MDNPDSRYKTIFDTVGASIWEEDWSEVITLLNSVKEKGITDFRIYLQENTDFAVLAAKKIKVLDVNDHTLKLYKAESKEQLFSSLIMVFEKPFTTFKEELVAIYEGKNKFESEAVNQTLTGEKIDVLLTLTHPEWDKEFKHVVITIMDIGKRKKVEKALNSSLREKEILLNELHHRTKNNMQIIVGMLSLKSGYITDSGVQDIFSEMQNRIYSMSMVHEDLYHSNDLSSIDLKDYVEELGNHLLNAFSVLDGRIKIKYNLKNVLLSIDTAVPLGLVLNELFSNSFKHAFPGDREGQIDVVIMRSVDGFIEISVSDNGIGTDLDFRKNNSMGMQLIFEICEQQLGGSISFQNQDGLSWNIKFKDIKNDRLKTVNPE